MGRIVDVQDFPEARRPAYKLQVDLGPALGIKKPAQVTQNYNHDDLKGKTGRRQGQLPAQADR